MSRKLGDTLATRLAGFRGAGGGCPTGTGESTYHSLFPYHVSGSSGGFSRAATKMDHYSHESAYRCTGASSSGATPCASRLSFNPTPVTTGRHVWLAPPARQSDAFTYRNTWDASRTTFTS